MLTVDLVQARTKGRELVLVALGKKGRERAAELAGLLLELVRERVGATRDEVTEAVASLEVGPRERRLVEGLAKLIDDSCEYSEVSAVDPVALRRDVFLRAAAARRALPDGSDFDRDAVLAECAALHGLTPEAIEPALFSDLRGAERLLSVGPLGPAGLVEAYERAQVQAVLLRAVRVVAEVHCASAIAARALFRKLKFLQLLHTIEERGEGLYTITIDGPYSMFEAVTKYGLKLALVLPALEECGRLELVADVRWGKQRRALTFRHEHRGRPAGAGAEPVSLPDDVRALHDAFAALDTRWRVGLASRIFDLPGIGLCVPDLEFTHPDVAAPVYLEVLGYWSRDAVWRRVELVEGGLAERVLFAVSARLRVSEAVLGERESGALYVYKGTMSARAVERKLQALAAR